MALAEPSARLTVEVMVGVAPRQVLQKSLQMPVGSTVAEVLQACGLMMQAPGLTLEAVASGLWAVGVWARKERLTHILRDQDRIEFVRALLVDPKEARRLRYKTHLQTWPKGSQRIKAKKEAPSSGA